LLDECGWLPAVYDADLAGRMGAAQPVDGYPGPVDVGEHARRDERYAESGGDEGERDVVVGGFVGDVQLEACRFGEGPQAGAVGDAVGSGASGAAVTIR
jgi:hypothetical protein